LETRYFSFAAFADSRASARRALIAGLRLHGAQYALPADWYDVFAGDIYVSEIIIGASYRDHSILT